MEDYKNNKPVIYRCNGVKCRKKKGFGWFVLLMGVYIVVKELLI